MKNKVTQIAIVQKMYASNRAFIQKVATPTDEEYNALMFETGCRFLEELYPIKTGFEKYYKPHAYSKIFWSWWKIEYKQWEQEFIKYTKDSDEPVSKKLWQAEMHQIAFDSEVEYRFQTNYQKKLSDVAK